MTAHDKGVLPDAGALPPMTPSALPETLALKIAREICIQIGCDNEDQLIAAVERALAAATEEKDAPIQSMAQLPAVIAALPTEESLKQSSIKYAHQLLDAALRLGEVSANDEGYWRDLLADLAETCFKNGRKSRSKLTELERENREPGAKGGSYLFRKRSAALHQRRRKHRDFDDDGTQSNRTSSAQRGCDVKRLVELNPKWIGVHNWNSDSVYHIGIAFDSPEGKRQKLAILFDPPIDPDGLAQKYGWGAPFPEAKKWRRTGDTFDTLTLEPSLDFSASGHWHGHIINGGAT